ncbi:putative Flavin-containing monooxygenase FMO GS-OX-like 3 [Hypsibius exemplaris]|uniref:Flavin-containing monooxygenase n=1 Tax=Hypsibius exemplaris TaxID=2072580 RepID=A0A1W0XB31_HYPEX|nr:putative Flavin-containing monooxygenase FMO GS-OX-like 3 [Hypsibius exemplaris]
MAAHQNGPLAEHQNGHLAAHQNGPLAEHQNGPLAEHQNGHSMKKKIAVIGAGMTGLCTLRHFALDPDYDVVAFERMDTIAGVWNYPEGCEKYTDEPDTSTRYCRTYRNLRTNSPRDLTRYPDFPFPKEVTESYCNRATVRKYFDAYTEHFGLLPFIRFRHKVEQITPVGKAGGDDAPTKWQVTVRDLESGTVTTNEFDNVIVCSGHFHTPYLPKIEGIEKFKGTVMHSCEYRVPEAFQDKNVLIIGAKTSAMDITTEIVPFARQVIVYRRFKVSIFEAKFPNVSEIADLVDFGADHLVQKDGTVRPIDAVILCTGYIFDYPFLSPECHVTVSRGRVAPLWRHLIHCEFPTLAFVGLANMAIFIQVADAQVRFYKAVTDGRVTLPNENIMRDETEAEFQGRLKQGIPEHLAHEMITSQWDYVAELAQEAGFEPFPPVARKMFEANGRSIRAAPYEFRNYRMERLDAENFVREPLNPTGKANGIVVSQEQLDKLDKETLAGRRNIAN